MHYELWDVATSNAIDVFRTEAEGLAAVRDLLILGWDPDQLALGVEYDEGEPGDDADLPPVLSGAALAQRARAAADRPAS